MEYVINQQKVNFEVIECYSCHVLFAVTEEHKRVLLGNKESFFCPNGHSQSYIGTPYKEQLLETKNALEICKNDKNELYKRIREQNEKLEKNVKVERALRMNISRMKKKKD